MISRIKNQCDTTNFKMKVDLEISQIENQCDITTLKNWIGDIALMKRGKKSYTCFN